MIPSLNVSRNVSFLLALLLIFGLVLPIITFKERLDAFMWRPEVASHQPLSWQCSTLAAATGLGTFSGSGSSPDENSYLVWSQYVTPSKPAAIYLSQVWPVVTKAQKIITPIAHSHLDEVAYHRQPDGAEYVAYSSESAVLISQRFTSGEDWSKPKPVWSAGSDQFARLDHLAFSTGPDDEIWLTFVNTHQSSRPGLYVSRSQDGGVTWSDAALLGSIPYADPTAKPYLAHLKNHWYLTYAGTLYHYDHDDPFSTWEELGDQNSTALTAADEVGYLFREYKVETDKEHHVDGGYVTGYTRVGWQRLTEDGVSSWRPTALHRSDFPFSETILGISASGKDLFTILYEPKTRLVDVTAADTNVAALLVETQPTPVRNNLKVIYSTDTGTSWSAPLTVREVFGAVYDPQLISTKDTLTLFWRQCLTLSETNQSVCQGPSSLLACTTNLPD
jgi:hypothetical protein